MSLKVFIATAFIAVLPYILFNKMIGPLPPPKLDITKYWGPSLRANRIDCTAVKPFQIKYSADVINKLRDRLSEPLNLVEPLEGVAFRYGFNAYKLEDLIKYWREDYLSRWDQRQKFLNNLPQFTTQIQGSVNLDYTAKAKNVIPLLLLHGWPGSVREFYEFILKLTQVKDDTSYSVVGPSLPGYDWSDGASVPGLNPIEIAIVLRNLMIRLGYERFLVQGGDWGAAIGKSLSALFPDNVIGFHCNLCTVLTIATPIKGFIASFYPSLFIADEYKDFVFPTGEKLSFLIQETGFFHLQATKPDTIGIALSNNLIGLAAYILEKFPLWTDKNSRDTNDGGFERYFTKDALFDNIMIYYLTNSITTSARLYAKGLGAAHSSLQMDRVPIQVPTGCARSKNDLSYQLDWQINVKFPNLIHSTYHSKGGHFVALELPELLYADFTEFTKKLNVTISSGR